MANLLRRGDNKIVFSRKCPISGEWKKGDIIFNTAPSPSVNVGWVCVTAGNPGEWKAFGRIQ